VRRTDSGKKIAVRGSRRGLTFALPVRQYAGTSVNEPVFVVEGASDTAAGVALGLDIVGRPSATGGLEFLVELLRGRHVCILGENDNAGRLGARKIATGLLSECPSVRIVFPPEAHKDLRCWVAEGVATRGDVLEAAVRAAPLPASSNDASHVAAEAAASNGLTRPSNSVIRNSGIVRALADKIAETDRFAIDAGGTLYRFERGVYQPHGREVVRRRCKELLIWWGRSRQWSTHRVAEVASYIATDAPRLWERPPPDRLNVRNGILVLGTRTLVPHDPDYLSAVQLPVEYDPSAKCPATERFVAGVYPEDAVDAPWQVRASVMLPPEDDRAILFLGEGANGKSTELAAVQAFTGAHNTSAVPLHRLESDRFSVARLMGKMANICADLPAGALLGTSVFKAITGRDHLLAERKFAESFELRTHCRLLFSANHAPRSPDASVAFFRRWVVYPCTRTFEEGNAARRDRAELEAELSHPLELSGVLNRALDAWPNLRANGFTITPSMAAAAADFRRTTDPLSVWLERNAVRGPKFLVGKEELRNAYGEFVARAGIPAPTANALTRAVASMFPGIKEGQRTRGGRLVWCWLGLGLLGGGVP
jgi:P4 family phage/plasmid primase-like protien